MPCLIKKLQGMWQTAHLKQHFLSSTFIMCIMCIYFIGSVVKTVLYFNFSTQRMKDFNKLKRNMNDGTIVFLTSLLIFLT